MSAMSIADRVVRREITPEQAALLLGDEQERVNMEMLASSRPRWLPRQLYALCILILVVLAVPFLGSSRRGLM